MFLRAPVKCSIGHTQHIQELRLPIDVYSGALRWRAGSEMSFDTEVL